MRQKRTMIVVAVWLAAFVLAATGCSGANTSGSGTNNGSGMMDRGGSTSTTSGP